MKNNKIKAEPQPEYVYTIIPSEYVCVYHKILVMLADYGEEMLKDCKASCTERNSSVIECLNMFNAAVASAVIGKTKQANLIINYVKAKINQIYKGQTGDPGYVFPIDKHGHIKAFVSCNDRPTFWISPDDGVLHKKNMNLGVRELYSFDKRDKPFMKEFPIPLKPKPVNPFDVFIDSSITEDGELIIDLIYYINGSVVEDDSFITTDYYFDNVAITSPKEVKDIAYGKHILTVVCEYNDGNEKYLIDKSEIVVREIKTK